MHFRVSWVIISEGTEWTYIDAETDKEALMQAIMMLEEDNLTFEESSIKVETVTANELIDEIIETAKAQMFDLFIGLHYNKDDTTIREYANIKKKFEHDKEFRLQVYRDVQRYHRTWKMVRKYCDTDKMTASEMIEAVNRLWEIDDSEEYQKEFEALPKNRNTNKQK